MVGWQGKINDDEMATNPSVQCAEYTCVGSVLSELTFQHVSHTHFLNITDNSRFLCTDLITVVLRKERL